MIEKQRDKERKGEKEREREIKHLSVHQQLRSAIPDSQQPSSPIGFLCLKLPPPPCAVLLVHMRTGWCVCVKRSFITTHFIRKFLMRPIIFQLSKLFKKGNRPASVRSGLQAQVKAPCLSITRARVGMCLNSFKNGNLKCKAKALLRESGVIFRMMIFVTGVLLTHARIPWCWSPGFTIGGPTRSAKHQNYQNSPANSLANFLGLSLPWGGIMKNAGCCCDSGAGFCWIKQHLKSLWMYTNWIQQTSLHKKRVQSLSTVQLWHLLLCVLHAWFERELRLGCSESPLDSTPPLAHYHFNGHRLIIIILGTSDLWKVLWKIPRGGQVLSHHASDPPWTSPNSSGACLRLETMFDFFDLLRGIGFFKNLVQHGPLVNHVDIGMN